MNKIFEALKQVGVVVVGGWLLGIVLDEAAGGKFGTPVQNLAKKATKGFGI